MPLNILSEKQKECKHEFKRISNCWFNFYNGDSMCVGLCIKCDLKKEIKTSITI